MGTRGVELTFGCGSPGGQSSGLQRLDRPQVFKPVRQSLLHHDQCCFLMLPDAPSVPAR